MSLTTASPPEAATGVWTPGERTLAFRLGEVTLYSWRLRTLAQELPLLALASRPLGAALPLDRLSRDADALFAPASEGSPGITRLHGAIRYVLESRVNYYIGLRGTFAQYLSGLPAKSRHEMMRKVRRFAGPGAAVGIRQYRSVAEAVEFHRMASAISAKTYQSRLLKIALPPVADLCRLADAGRLRAYLLFQDSRPAAYGLCAASCGDLDYQQTGYDPEFHDLSPGIVLLHGILESAFAEGVWGLLDFGFGESQWKRAYATGSVRYSIAYYLRPGLKNLLLARTHRSITAASDRAGAALEAWGVKERLKRLLRRRAGKGDRDAA
jgi:CelD/BcsL family acetyltransferase involved in cellulose biosynthesis